MSTKWPECAGAATLPARVGMCAPETAPAAAKTTSAGYDIFRIFTFVSCPSGVLIFSTLGREREGGRERVTSGRERGSSGRESHLGVHLNGKGGASGRERVAPFCVWHHTPFCV